MSEGGYSSIREILGFLIGRKVVDITQQDKEDWDDEGKSFVCLMFDNGCTLMVHCDKAPGEVGNKQVMSYLNPDDPECTDEDESEATS